MFHAHLNAPLGDGDITRLRSTVSTYIGDTTPVSVLEEMLQGVHDVALQIQALDSEQCKTFKEALSQLSLFASQETEVLEYMEEHLQPDWVELPLGKRGIDLAAEEIRHMRGVPTEEQIFWNYGSEEWNEALDTVLESRKDAITSLSFCVRQRIAAYVAISDICPFLEKALLKFGDATPGSPQEEQGLIEAQDSCILLMQFVSNFPNEYRLAFLNLR